MSSTELVPLENVVAVITKGYWIPNNCKKIMRECRSRAQVIRQASSPKDKLELTTDKGILILGMDSNEDEIAFVSMRPTKDKTHYKDVIRPVCTPETEHIVVISNITGYGQSTIHKICIKR